MRRSRRDGQGAQPRRGLGTRRDGRTEPLTDAERIAAVAHDAHVPVEDVLREVADFRLALETDMIIAAAAADADADALLSEVVDGERAELADFHDRLIERLADAAASDELALRRERRRESRLGIARPSRWIAAAAAAAAILGTGGAAVRQGGNDSATTINTNSVALATASQQYADLSHAVNSESPAEMRDAAAELHETLERLIAQHAGDPEVAQRAAQLLQAEISLLQVRDPAGASQVIAQANTLVRMLRHAAPPQVRATVAPILDAVTSQPPKKPAKTKPSATPTKATSSPSPKATPSASPSASPSSKSASTEPDGNSPLEAP